MKCPNCSSQNLAGYRRVYFNEDGSWDHGDLHGKVDCMDCDYEFDPGADFHDVVVAMGEGK